MNEAVKQVAIVIVVSIIGLIGITYFFTSSFGSSDVRNNESIIVNEQSEPIVINPDNQNDISNMNNPKAVVETNRGTFTLELFEDVMPITVGNFISLAEEGFYDGIQFHRVIEGFMIQAGDPNTKEEDTSRYVQGGPGYTIQDEFVIDERLTNVRGTISMANTGQPNSGGSQFFINTNDNTNLDHDKQPLTSRHPVFGRVISGYEIVEIIETTETDMRDLPVDRVVIERVTIER